MGIDKKAREETVKGEIIETIIDPVSTQDDGESPSGCKEQCQMFSGPSNSSSLFSFQQ